MKRGPGPKRTTGLTVKSAPKPRAKPIPKKNAARAKKRHAEAFGPEGFVEFVHSYGCVVAQEKGPLSGCEGPSEAAHLKSRGAGGGWRENVVPLCRKHHAEQHRHGIKSFDVRHNMDLDLWAAAVFSRWVTDHPTKESE